MKCINLFKSVACVCSIGIVLFSQSGRCDQFNATKIAEFSKFENVESMVFHDNQLWVAKSISLVSPPAYDNSVDVFDSSGRIHHATLQLPFLPDRMYPFSEHQVIVVGKHYSDHWRTYFSIITSNPESYSVSTTTLPKNYQVDEFIGSPQAMFFGEPGSNKIYEYRRTLFGSSMTPLAPLIHGPGKMFMDGSDLWVIIRNGHAFGDENVGKINLDSQTMGKTFEQLREGITNIYAMKNERVIVVNEIGRDQILFIDANANRLTDTLPIENAPYGFTELGSCLAVTGEKSISFVKKAQGRHEVVIRWDLKTLGQNMDAPRNIAVDQQTNRLYVRSANMCPTCDLTRNSVFVFEPGADVLKACVD
ncbi:MAG: hypothetical protein HY537_05950 [Deltaproteobacteria bacterium]|nr:hypothetical protein [Deltaproteobacteria bacterium]